MYTIFLISLTKRKLHIEAPYSYFYYHVNLVHACAVCGNLYCCIFAYVFADTFFFYFFSILCIDVLTLPTTARHWLILLSIILAAMSTTA